jgi:hypothetical protein
MYVISIQPKLTKLRNELISDELENLTDELHDFNNEELLRYYAQKKDDHRYNLLLRALIKGE